MDQLQPWIVDDTEKMLGSEVKIAVSNQSTKNQKLYAISVREVFDSKSSGKELPLFVTGKYGLETANCWVAIKKEVTISVDTLFSDKVA